MPISEDASEIIRVPVVFHVPVLPYYAAEQRYAVHADGCAQCSGDSCLPCPTGGWLGDDAWRKRMDQQHLARQN
jgi:hypothetical protein